MMTILSDDDHELDLMNRKERWMMLLELGITV